VPGFATDGQTVRAVDEAHKLLTLRLGNLLHEEKTAALTIVPQVTVDVGFVNEDGDGHHLGRAECGDGSHHS